jgi:hypothetical protein
LGVFSKKNKTTPKPHQNTFEPRWKFVVEVVGVCFGVFSKVLNTR